MVPIARELIHARFQALLDSPRVSTAELAEQRDGRPFGR